jgi:hypothetical protein
MKRLLPDDLDRKIITFLLACVLAGLGLGDLYADYERRQHEHIMRGRRAKGARNMRSGRRRNEFVFAR